MPSQKRTDYNDPLRATRGRDLRRVHGIREPSHHTTHARAVLLVNFGRSLEPRRRSSVRAMTVFVGGHGFSHSSGLGPESLVLSGNIAKNSVLLLPRISIERPPTIIVREPETANGEATVW